jgi:hypothetical protein
MSKIAVIGMLAGGAFLFILIIGLFIFSLASPAQVPPTQIDQAFEAGINDDSIEDGPFQGFNGAEGDTGSFGSDSSFSQGGGFDGSGDLLPVIDSEYGQLPAGEVKDDYVVVPNDRDNNGFVDSEETGSFGGIGGGFR